MSGHSAKKETPAEGRGSKNASRECVLVSNLCLLFPEGVGFGCNLLLTLVDS